MTLSSQHHKHFLGPSSCEVLEIERDRLQNSCQHLERSIKELEEEIHNSGPDPDFKEAVEVVLYLPGLKSGHTASEAKHACCRKTLWPLQSSVLE